MFLDWVKDTDSNCLRLFALGLIMADWVIRFPWRACWADEITLLSLSDLDWCQSLIKLSHIFIVVFIFICISFRSNAVPISVSRSRLDNFYDTRMTGFVPKDLMIPILSPWYFLKTLNSVFHFVLLRNTTIQSWTKVCCKYHSSDQVVTSSASVDIFITSVNNYPLH